MRSPSRTLQISIFEPLYARADEDLHFQPTAPIQSAWLPQGPASPSPASSAPPPPFKGCTTTRRAAATVFNHNVREDSCSGLAGERLHDHNSITRDHHTSLGMHYSPNFGTSSTAIIQPTSTQSSCPPSRSLSSSDVVDCADDGSIASKLLGSITKSISSPSLLACCKESARETPYQKALRLREMKLQHCAEELGSESSDGRSLSNGGYGSVFDRSRTMMGSFEISAQPPTEIMNYEAHPKSGGNPTPAMISVRSSPNLRCTSNSLLSKTKERSFPPPLTHTLPRSSSSDSFSYSLRAYREGGHFLLKEVKVPCRQYFQSSRKDGRLNLRLFTTDENLVRQYSEEDDKDCKGLQTDVEFSMYQATGDGPGDPTLLDGGASEKIEVESTNGASCVGESLVCRVEESCKKIDVSMNSGADAERFRCRSALDSLHIATLSNDSSARSKINVISHKYGALNKVDFDFTTANCKTCTVSYLSFSNQHDLLPSSLRHEQPLIHPPRNCPKLQLGYESNGTTRVSACGHCGVSFGMELRGGAASGGAKMILSQRGTEAQSVGCSSTHLPTGYGLSRSTPASMIIFKDVNAAKCLMESMSKLVATFENMDGGKWSYGGEVKKRSRQRESSTSTDGIKDSSMCHGIKSINIGMTELDHNHHKANIINGSYSFDVRSGRKPRRSSCAVEESSRDHHIDGTSTAESSRHPMSSCHVNLHEIPSSIHSQAAGLRRGKLQGKEWLHTLHCKEILYRNQLPGKGFMKLHCVA